MSEDDETSLPGSDQVLAVFRARVLSSSMSALADYHVIGAVAIWVSSVPYTKDGMLDVMIRSFADATASPALTCCLLLVREDADLRPETRQTTSLMSPTPLPETIDEPSSDGPAWTKLSEEAT